MIDDFPTMTIAEAVEALNKTMPTRGQLETVEVFFNSQVGKKMLRRVRIAHIISRIFGIFLRKEQ